MLRIPELELIVFLGELHFFDLFSKDLFYFCVREGQSIENPPRLLEDLGLEFKNLSDAKQLLLVLLLLMLSIAFELLHEPDIVHDHFDLLAQPFDPFLEERVDLLELLQREYEHRRLTGERGVYRQAAI